jgi:catechol 2,3-dioxygenase-like lactoylglutathione lyase family enzyme
MQIGEVVLRTARFEAMNRWWQTVLGVSPFLESERFAFRRLPSDYPYTQLLIIFNRPELGDRESSGPGLDHVQFRHASLGALLDRYEILRDLGIKPHRTMNHGPATSFYYRDPDGNGVELSAMNFPTEAEYSTFVTSEAFKSGSSTRPPSRVPRRGRSWCRRARSSSIGRSASPTRWSTTAGISTP